MNWREEVVVFLATGFYIGNIPYAPGTLGSLVGLPICFILAGLKLPQATAGALLLIFFAIWIANSAERVLDRTDPGCIVIDEVAGMVVTLIGLPFNLTTAVFGFFCFRILDILKPFPIRLMDKKLSGGLGVVADDVAAGILANLLIRVIIFFF
ncbi:MAG: phosphatidylglycerophosphatase A [Desulfobacterales bacterium]|nr:MAG: phosphatidylglycerophosphatase A [Desulfobacterales bacterium]